MTSNMPHLTTLSSLRRIRYTVGQIAVGLLVTVDQSEEFHGGYGIVPIGSSLRKRANPAAGRKLLYTDDCRVACFNENTIFTKKSRKHNFQFGGHVVKTGLDEAQNARAIIWKLSTLVDACTLCRSPRVVFVVEYGFSTACLSKFKHFFFFFFLLISDKKK